MTILILDLKEWILIGHIFNISWLVGGHPILDVEQLGQEADGNLAHLLDQLQAQHFLKLPGPVAIVLVNRLVSLWIGDNENMTDFGTLSFSILILEFPLSLASIAKRRYATYGRILPALIGLGPICEEMKGPQRASVIHAVKNALLSLLKCTHSGVGLVSATSMFSFADFWFLL